MLDVTTMRVVFALIGLTMLFLFSSTYRATRVPISAWWCLALGLFLLASVLWIFNGTAAQPFLNPLGNVASVCGASAVWLGARSNRGARPRWFVLVPLPVASGAISYLDHPGQSIWPGGGFYLAAMSILFILASTDLWLARRSIRLQGQGLSPVTTTLASVCSMVATFYFFRTWAFLLLGAESDLFVDWFGAVPHTLLMLVMLVAASHTMGSLGQERLVFDLRRSAEHDDLTGLLNRRAFFQLASRELARAEQSAVVVADLDHFKLVNDRHGHGLGDQVLISFAESMGRATRSTDLCARFGGEEFVILMPGADVHAAEAATKAINRLLQINAPLPHGEKISSSFGIATVDSDIDLATALTHADAALYRAKHAGRARAVIYSAGSLGSSPTGWEAVEAV